MLHPLAPRTAQRLIGSSEKSAVVVATDTVCCVITDGAVLRLESTTGLQLEFGADSSFVGEDPYLGRLRVRVSGDFGRIEQRVLFLSGDGLREFLGDLYEDFRGWDGNRTWRSLEGELTVTAHHDGHVHLRWELSDRMSVESPWTFACTTTHGPGEDIRQLADALSSLLITLGAGGS